MRRRGLLRPAAPPRAPTTPPNDEKFQSAVSEYLQLLQFWLSGFVQNFQRREQSTDDALSRIEFPTPDSHELGGANVGISLVRFVFRQPTATGIFPAVEIRHNLERIPRFWWVVQPAATGRSAPFAGPVLDQIVSSQFPFAYAAGYPTVDVDAVDPRKITGGGAGSWLGNDVRVDDEILIEYYDAAPGTTANLVAGDRLVTAAAGVFDPGLIDGAYVRFPAQPVPMKGWNLVEQVKSPTRLLLSSPSTTTAAATAAEFQLGDLLWHRIVAVTATTLTLDPKGPGTSIPVGTVGCPYVIRRRPNDKTAWVRVPIDGDDPVVLLLAFA